MAEMKPARLTEEALREIQALETRLGGICLLAVERAMGMWAVEAKEGPNDWRPIHLAYPDLEGLKSYYLKQEDALLAKAAFKSLLAGRPDLKGRKRPIRVRNVGGQGD
jgi:hypothetical protein